MPIISVFIVYWLLNYLPFVKRIGISFSYEMRYTKISYYYYFRATPKYPPKRAKLYLQPSWAARTGALHPNGVEPTRARFFIVTVGKRASVTGRACRAGCTPGGTVLP